MFNIFPNVNKSYEKTRTNNVLILITSIVCVACSTIPMSHKLCCCLEMLKNTQINDTFALDEMFRHCN